MLTEDDDFPGGRRGIDFLAGGEPEDAGGDESRFFIAIERLLGQHRSAPVGGDGSPRSGSSGCSSGGGNVNHRAKGGFLAFGGLGLLGRHGGERECVRARGHVRARSTEEEDEAGTEGTNEIWSPRFYNRKGIRKTLENDGAACHDKCARIPGYP